MTATKPKFTIVDAPNEPTTVGHKNHPAEHPAVEETHLLAARSDELKGIIEIVQKQVVQGRADLKRCEDNYQIEKAALEAKFKAQSEEITGNINLDVQRVNDLTDTRAALHVASNHLSALVGKDKPVTQPKRRARRV